ncbi:MAG: signal peptidase II [Bdellovibrionales bacterium]
MKKRDWAIVAGLVIAVWGVDQATKLVALKVLTSPFPVIYGPAGFMLHLNPGVIFGTFANLPPILRVVSLSTAGAFLTFIYAAIQYLLPTRSLHIRCGMSMLLGGILGNVTDRIITGKVVDFVYLKAGSLNTAVFNVADAVQWIGYGFLVYGLLKDGPKLWPDQNARKKLWVNPGFQMKYTLKMVGLSFLFSIVNGVFAYTFLKVTIDELSGREAEQRFLTPFVITYGVMTVGFMFTMFILGRILSHRTAGPIHAFENYIRDLFEGRDRKLKLRKGDEFRPNLEDLADQIKPMIKDRRKAKRE